MNLGYARISKADGSQTLDLQTDALHKAGVSVNKIYSDKVSGKNTERPQLIECLKSLRSGDTLIVWKLDRLGRSLQDLVSIVNDLSDRNIQFKVITGHGADIDTTTAAGRMVFGIFASLAEFERDLIAERVQAGLAAARARGRIGGRKPAMTPAKIRLAQAAMQSRDTSIPVLCKELGVSPATLYRYVSAQGELRESALKVIKKHRKKSRKKIK